MQRLQKSSTKNEFAYDKLYLRIDYIFHDLNFKCLNFVTDNTPETHKLSDHYPIYAVLEFKK